MEEEERARRADRLALAQGQRDRMLDRVTQVRGGGGSYNHSTSHYQLA